ncbi:MAG TPA: 50S ribosomal protein L29 [Candidatus Dojkabacteria bacterium]|nr:50S ribosomal protein L29 [Candidatus Dojkabacteria bacterium]
MKARDFRKMTYKKLSARVKEKQLELNTLEFDLKLGQVKNTADLKKLRKEIARIKTVLNAQEYAPAEEENQLVVKKVKVVKKTETGVKAVKENSIKNKKITK